jgi:hypothetical protein
VSCSTWSPAHPPGGIVALGATVPGQGGKPLHRAEELANIEELRGLAEKLVKESAAQIAGVCELPTSS